ncbi:MAG TPA: ABC transporter substrate-binding protein [Casimicrobiaceae bacterium]|nr:ABC transporter substrate-binding protein [Casimicrobiaceae bacterium]
MLALARFVLLAWALLALAPSHGAFAADMHKVLRIASNDITSLDPQQGTDLYSTRVATSIFEGLYEFEYLSSGSKVIPCTAEALPAIGDDGKTWTMRVKKGIYFTDDPAFKGKPRELVAADYAYAIERVMDPNLRSGGDPALSDLIVGARAIVDAARMPGGKFDYDAPMAGLSTPDRYTLVIKLVHPDYTLLERLAGLNMMAVAREVVEAAGADVLRHPVGTGPYRLKEWRPASRVVLEANPKYRKVVFPENADAPQQDLVRAMRGKTLPVIGRIEISIIEESQPEILAFSQGGLDYVALGGDDMKRVMENGALRPDLAGAGVRHLRYTAPSLGFTYFNMDDPIVGGYSTSQIALRRAIGMGFDVNEMIRVLFAGNALPANQLLPPGVSGHDPALPPKSLYDPASARALLDRFGFRDRDGDGYRETPDGKPLTVVRGTLPESWYREVDLLWKKSMDAIGIRMKVQQQTFAELNNLSRAGKLPMFNLGYRSLEPSGYQILQTLWSKESRDVNPAQFKNADYDAAYEQFLRTPAGPGRVALARRMSELSQAFMPMILHTYAIGNVLEHPWVEGYWPSPFGFAWKYLDLDVAMRNRMLAAAKK